MSANIVALYGAILAIGFVGLSVRTLRLRRTLNIAIGDAGNPIMLRAMRVHSNFAEYVPLGLILILLVELNGAPGWMVHLLGACLIVGRSAHAYGVSQVNENYRFRVFGMAMTFTALLVCSAFLLLSYVTGLEA
jgi:hypothetical protein